jgi:hypothetical protein
LETLLSHPLNEFNEIIPVSILQQIKDTLSAAYAQFLNEDKQHGGQYQTNVAKTMQLRVCPQEVPRPLSSSSSDAVSSSLSIESGERHQDAVNADAHDHKSGLGQGDGGESRTRKNKRDGCHPPLAVVQHKIDPHATELLEELLGMYEHESSRERQTNARRQRHQSVLWKHDNCDILGLAFHLPSIWKVDLVEISRKIHASSYHEYDPCRIISRYYYR